MAEPPIAYLAKVEVHSFPFVFSPNTHPPQSFRLINPTDDLIYARRA